MPKIYLLFFLMASTAMASCSRDDDAEGSPNQPTPSCDEQALPIVFVHGFLASGDTYANTFMRFSSNGTCPNRMFAFDWNSIAQQTDQTAALDAFIDEVLSSTGAEAVDLAGHSAGGGVCYTYLSDSLRAAKVAHYAHIGSTPQEAAAGVPTLHIWSPDDLIVEGGDIDGATNVTLPGQDHYEVATSAESFEAMFGFFRGEAPAVTAIQKLTRVEIGGKVLALGLNSPVEGATVHLYALDSITGQRTSNEALTSLTSGPDGKWGPFSMDAGISVEFEVIPPSASQRRVHYIRQAFRHHNELVYLRTLPEPGSLLDLFIAGLPTDDVQSVLILFLANQGLVFGHDALAVDGFELANETFASPEGNTIAFFLYDGNDNQTTDLSPQGLFGSFPFLESADMFLSANGEGPIYCVFNGRTLAVPRIPSASGGLTIAVME